jgi:hypothetical protein
MVSHVRRDVHARPRPLHSFPSACAIDSLHDQLVPDRERRPAALGLRWVGVDVPLRRLVGRIEAWRRQSISVRVGGGGGKRGGPRQTQDS